MLLVELCCGVGVNDNWDLFHTRRNTHPAILVKYARNGVPERTTGSCIVGEYSKQVASRGTHVADRNGEKEEKYPEVQIESLAGGSGLTGNPKCKEPKQASSVERDGQISLHAEQPNSVRTREKVAMGSIPGR